MSKLKMAALAAMLLPATQALADEHMVLVDTIDVGGAGHLPLLPCRAEQR